MNTEEIKLLKDVVVNSLIEITRLKNELKDSKESSNYWYSQAKEAEKQIGLCQAQLDEFTEPKLSEV